MTVIVGIGGYAGSGKDTAAQALVDLGFERRAFADILRDFLYELDPIISSMSGMRLRTLVAYEGWDEAKRGYPEVRALLQRCGTDAGRKVLGEDVWVDGLLNNLDHCGAYVIPDVRFPNEAEAIIRRNGYLLRVDRPGVGPAAAPDGSIHPSETALDRRPEDQFWWFDDTLVNAGTVEELHAQVHNSLRRWASIDERLQDLVPPVPLEPTC